MNCSKWEERIAWYAGGDAEEPDVERHLADCPACRTYAAELRESLAWGRDVHRDPIAPAHFAAVRTRVMAELQRKGRPWWRTGWTYGMAAAAAILIVLAALRPPAAPVVTPRRQAVMHFPSPEVAPPAVVKAVHAKARRRRVRPQVAQAKPGPSIMVKLVTDDPDVVIYWITEKSGE